MCVSRLVPVPKASQPQAPLDKHQYRGISVQAIIAKVYDRVIHSRLDTVAEGEGLRAPTQCGFRRGCGTVDALFSVQHLVSKFAARRQPLYALFVDFKKAFDMVRRDLLLERCRKLGIQGVFLQALEALYDKVLLQVSINGALGQPFETHAGTKQGSELSPLLFGLFVELLHELIRLELPGVGPVVAGMTLPDILYADDCLLLATNPSDSQRLLDVLALFCKLFGMQVNLAPHKTCMVVFRPQGVALPAGMQLHFDGQAVPVQDTYNYLGLHLHATQGITQAPRLLAEAGRRALHAMLGRLRSTHLSQFDIRCRMFDVLVEPVLSYGCQVWGPAVFHNRMLSGQRDVFMSDAEKVHMHFLRGLAGVGKCCVDVLMRDMHRQPVMHHWVVLGARQWSKFVAMGEGQPRVSRSAWLSDIDLMRGADTNGRPYKKCWTYRLLSTLQQLGVLQPSQWDQSADLTQLRIDEQQVKARLVACMHTRWAGMVAGDPRVAPSDGIAKLTHASWVYPYQPAVDYTDRQAAPQHIQLCLPTRHLRVLAQLRVGWGHLEVELGRRQRPRVPRPQRLCRVCGGGVVEDLLHFVFECTAYTSIRSRYQLQLEGTQPSACMMELFAHAQQSKMARMLFDMKAHRARVLGCPF